MSIIKNIVQWAKYRRLWILFWGGLALLVLASFGVGFLVGQEKNQTPIIIETHSP